MALSKENVIVVFNTSIENSEDFANAYLELHGLSSTQKIGITAGEDEILSSEDSFNNLVLDPIKSALQDPYGGIQGPYGEILVHAILLGYGVPGGFYDSEYGDIISATSRISRIYHPYQKKIKNNFYDRQVFKRFDAEDAEFALICTRIDAPDYKTALSVLENTDKFIRQVYSSGKVFIDPYSDLFGEEAEQYTSDILRFQSHFLPNLNLPTYSTVFTDPYIDPVVPSLNNDSFYWGWFTDRGSASFFKSTNAARIFFYNADYDASLTMRSLSERNWCPLATNAGYIASAGSISNPGIDGFLRPIPFFDALYRGATLGEALLFATPYLDWSISFFGDPLLTVGFPSSKIINDDVIEENEAWISLANDVCRSMSYIFHKEETALAILDIIVKSQDVKTNVDLFNPAVVLADQYNKETMRNDFKPIVASLKNFAESRSGKTLNEYLISKNYKVSQLLKDSLDSSIFISNSNIFDNGRFTIDYIIKNDNPNFTNYYFDLDVSLDNDFTNILYSVSSENTANWS